MKKLLLWMTICLAAVAVLLGAYYYISKKPVQNTLPPYSSPNHTETEAKSEPDLPLDINKPPYVLTILGKSKLLSQAQNINMDKWRNDVEKMALQRPGEIVLNGPSERKAVALTFDDGPDDLITPRIIAILGREGVKATFFVSGRQAERFPEQLDKMAKGAHLVLSHTYSHNQLVSLKSEVIEKEVNQTDSLIRQRTYTTPGAVRPPYGAINQDVVDLLSRKGKLVVLWSIDTLDWTGEDAKELAANVLDNVRPGDIVLMHSISARSNTVEALPIIIQGLRQKGYDIVRLDQLLGRNLEEP